jgi:hypothetical protein
MICTLHRQNGAMLLCRVADIIRKFIKIYNESKIRN